jgi:hypothetical protein
VQVHRHDDLLGGEGMADRKNAKRVAGHEGFMHDARRIDQVCCQTDIKLASRDQVAHVTRRQDKQCNPNLRMFPPKYRDCFRYDRLTGRKKGSNANLPRAVIANSSSSGTDQINAVEGSLNLVVQHASLGCGDQAIADPGKERETDRSLELDNASADRRLCYTKDLRRS